MDPFDPFASDREDDDDEEEEDVPETSLFSRQARKGLTVNGAYEEELYREVETTHLPPLGLATNDDFGFDEDDDEDEEEDESSVSQHEDVFGMSLADVDLWDDDDDEDDDGHQDDPFAVRKSTASSSQNIEFPGFAPMETKSESKRDSLKKSSSKTRHSSRSNDGKRRSSTSSSREACHRSKSLDEIEFLAPELSSCLTMKDNPFSTENERSARRSVTSSSNSKGPSRSRQPPPRSKSSDYSKDDFGDQDRIGELLNLIKREKAQETTTRKDRSSRGGSERSDRNKHRHSDTSGSSSLRQKLTTESASSDRRRMSSSAASTSSSGKRNSASGKEIRRQSYDESMSGWGDMGGESKRHPPRRTSSKTSGSKGGVGLDSFMKSNRPSRRGDAEHRSVVSAPATTSAETLSKKCQEMKLTF